MTENNIFEPDCNDCGENKYDYSRLNSRYEADVERDEIIEWNKDACNAQYRGLETIAEQLNFKEMQLEECRKGYEKLMEENNRLVTHLQAHLDAYRRVNKELHNIYDSVTLTKAIKLLDEVYDKYAEKNPNDDIASEKRKAIIECSDKLREFREDIR